MITMTFWNRARDRLYNRRMHGNLSLQREPRVRKIARHEPREALGIKVVQVTMSTHKLPLARQFRQRIRLKRERWRVRVE